MSRLPRRNRPPRIDPDAWLPPAVLPCTDLDNFPGTRSGARLYDQPAYQSEAERIRRFCETSGPLNVEVGVDRGYRLLAHARRWPEQRWLGIELRRTVLSPGHTPPSNALLVRGDARAVLSRLVPAHGVHRMDILFPSPSDNPRHILLTPAFARLVNRVLTPDGLIHIATDVPGMIRLVEQSFHAWSAVSHPPSGPVRSRREKACERANRRVWRWTLAPPPYQTGGAEADTVHLGD